MTNIKRSQSILSVIIVLIAFSLLSISFYLASSAYPLQPSSNDSSSTVTSLSSSSESSEIPSSSEESSEDISSEVSSEIISEIDVSPTPDLSTERYINSDIANFRSGPGSNYSIIRQLYYGTKVYFISNSGNWSYIYTTGEEKGYIFTSLLSNQKPSPKPTTEPVTKFLDKWPTEYTVSGFYDANLAQYLGRGFSEEYKPLTGITVIIDSGHGGVDGGAQYISTTEGVPNVSEKIINLAIAKKLGLQLETLGATIIYTREDDSYVSLYKRNAIINQTVLTKHKSILLDRGDDVTETQRLILEMQNIINANSDYENANARGIMYGIGTGVDLRTIFDISSEHKDIIMISIHCNSISNASYVNGLEIFYGTNEIIHGDETIVMNNDRKNNPVHKSYQLYDNALRHKLALSVVRQLDVDTEFTLRWDDGLKEANFCMIRENNLTGILIEVGFLSNSIDRGTVTDPSGQDIIAYAIAKGVYNYFCITDG